jgi:Coenzyme PQQ synthesis protein D (PqqD)
VKGDSTTPIRIHPDAVANRVGEQMVLVHLSTDRIFELNRTASRIWELLTEGKDPETIQKSLAQEFDISEMLAAQEVSELLKSLKAEKFIEDAI